MSKTKELWPLKLSNIKHTSYILFILEINQSLKERWTNDEKELFFAFQRYEMHNFYSFEI